MRYGAVVVETCRNTSQGQGKGGNTLRLAFRAREGVVVGRGMNTLRLAFRAREGVDRVVVVVFVRVVYP